MKRKDVGTARIERVDFPNEGRFRVPESGERGIVKNVMPGQTVSFRVYKKKKGSHPAAFSFVRDRLSMVCSTVLHSAGSRTFFVFVCLSFDFS